MSEENRLDAKEMTKKQLISELEDLQRRMADLEASTTRLRCDAWKEQDLLVQVEPEMDDRALHQHDLEQAYNALQLERQRYRDLFDFAPDGYLVTDSKGIINDANHTFSALIGVPAAWLRGSALSAYLSEESRPGFRRLLVRLRREETVSDWEALLKPRSGEAFPASINVSAAIDPGGQVSYFRWMVRDISPRKKVEQALRQTAERLRQIADALPQILWTADPDGAMDYFNQRWAEYTGLSNNSGQGDGWCAALHPDDREVTMEAWQRAVRTGRQYQIEHRVRGIDGKYRWFLSRGLPLRDDQGRITKWFGTATDIHDQKQAEQSLAEMTATLEQQVSERTAMAEERAAQLRSLAGELTQAEEQERRRLAQILHDNLQQLLAAAKIGVNIVQGRAQDKELADTLAQVDGLLSESIAASRSLTAELSSSVLYEAGLGAALISLGHQMQDKHHLSVEVEVEPDTEPQAESVRILLYQSVRELLFNVIKHAETDKATVRVMRAPDEQVQVIVQDKGIGFNPRRQAAGSSASSGFGLFSIRERLGLMGGRMEIDSAPGRGTRVHLYAPLCERGASETTADMGQLPIPPDTRSRNFEEVAELEGEEPRMERIRVLVADDHQIMRDGLISLLRLEKDIEVVGEAADGRKALDLSRSLKPDVVIMDVSLPLLSGVEATRRITAELSDVAIIGLSMHEMGPMAQAMRDAGAVAYLPKGGPSGDLVRAIRDFAPRRMEAIQA
ncbi:MAG: PAS domain S-box protein [Chloroflexi bacterium]|jgi:PAS domain S-box-containing protein|nr:PAS domain S-box protein [Chloroflexota bacterium]